MYNLEDVTKLPEDFNGQVRLFPLPNLVVFPHAMQPLHIFEPRYVEMLQDSVTTDRLIAMATLTPLGGPKWPTEQPPIAPTVCIGRILSHSEVESRKYNLLLVGIRRARMVAEIESGKPYRLGQVEMIDDSDELTAYDSSQSLKAKLLDAFGSVMPVGQSVQQNLQQLMSDQMGLGAITDIVGYTLPFSVEEKLELLQESSVKTRAEFLISRISEGGVTFNSDGKSEQQSPAKDFPPRFSNN